MQNKFSSSVLLLKQEAGSAHKLFVEYKLLPHTKSSQAIYFQCSLTSLWSKTVEWGHSDPKTLIAMSQRLQDSVYFPVREAANEIK